MQELTTIKLIKGRLLYLVRNYALIFDCEHYLFREVNSLSEQK